MTQELEDELFCSNCCRFHSVEESCSDVAKRELPTYEYGYLLLDDPSYVVHMENVAGVEQVRRFIDGTSGAVAVRRVIGPWEPA